MVGREGEGEKERVFYYEGEVERGVMEGEGRKILADGSYY